jgi:ribosomal protein L24E
VTVFRCAHCGAKLEGSERNYPHCDGCRLPFCSQKCLEEHTELVADDVIETFEAARTPG